MIASLRPARASDAASLAALRAAASSPHADWAEERFQVPAPDTDYVAQLLEQCRGLVYVAEAHGAVVGYLAMQREAHPAVAARRPIQLWQLYVAPRFHGSGVAAQLMSAALAHARAGQHDVIWVGVAEGNLRGIAFYRKQGFEAVGVHEVGSASHAHQDVLMSRSVH